MTAEEVKAIKDRGENDPTDPTIIQVTNMSVKSSDKQIRDLFGQIGEIVHVEIFPRDKQRNKFGTLVVFVEFEVTSSVTIAQHLTSTVFIDKPMVVIPAPGNRIPSEWEAMQLAAAMSSNKQLENNPLGTKIQTLVPIIAPTIPSHIANPVLGTKPQPNILIAGLGQLKDITDSTPQYGTNVELIAPTGVPMPTAPPLPDTLIGLKEKETRRTVFIDNLNPMLTAEHVMNYFQFCGDVRYLRIGGEDMKDVRFAFIEFLDLASVTVALQYDGAEFCDRTIRVIQSRHWLSKPPNKKSDTERENDVIMKRLMEAQAMIAGAMDNPEGTAPAMPQDGPKDKPKEDPKPRRRSRSPSSSKRRDRSSSRSRRHSRSKRSRSRSRSKDRSRSKRSRSKDRRRSRKSRSRSRGRR